MSKREKGFDPIKDMDEMAQAMKLRMKQSTVDDETMVKMFNATRQWVVDRHTIMQEQLGSEPVKGGVDAYREKLEAKGSPSGSGKAVDPALAGLPASIVDRIRPGHSVRTTEAPQDEPGSDGDVDEDHGGDSSGIGPFNVGSSVTIGGILVGDADSDGSNPH